MNPTAKFLLKCAAVWVVLMIGVVLGGLITGWVAPSMAPVTGHDGPFTEYTAVPVVCALFALVLGTLASRIRWSGWPRFLTLFCAVYVIGTVQSQIEAVYFNAYLKLSSATTIGALAGDAVKYTLAAAACAFLWRDAGPPTERIGGLWWKIPLLSLLYVVFYFGAGALIAWQGAAVRAYYEQGAHIDPVPLALLQVFRGAVWAGIALLLTFALTGSRLTRALLAGAALSVFMASQLLYPISFMPWDVRKFHIMEVGSSNFIYGLLAVLILTISWKRKSVSV